ncbi:tyrosine-type recombinase/integrase [Desulfobulbus elongatus]|uniref:tyrosine-type recombinase/integrase n=1 Tax=Desulfobulbus elongatus TaxID=53332 RepID=UPI000484A34C|nr:site-specific integrase [Desulfobulbus elongatus]
MATKYIRAYQNKFEGVYYYESQTRLFQGKPDKCFVVTFKVSGRKIWEKIGWKSQGITPQIANEKRNQFVQEIQLGSPIITAAMRKEEAFKRNRYIEEIAQIYFEKNKDRLKGYKTDLNRYEKHLKTLFGKRQVSTLTTLDIADLINSMNGKADGTIWNVVELLRRLINFGSKADLCPPLSFTINMPERNNEVVEYLTPEEVKRFFSTMRHWHNQEACRMLKLAYFTAMRRGEIFKLQDADLDFHFNLIRLRDPKGKKTTSIPMNPIAKEIIEEQIAWRDNKHPGSTYLFPGTKGGKRTDCSAIDPIKKTAQLPPEFRIFHSLRHHYAVTLANSGKYTLDMIGELLTHKSTAMTKRYGHFLPDTMQTAGEIAASLLANGTE